MFYKDVVDVFTMKCTFNIAKKIIILHSENYLIILFSKIKNEKLGAIR